MPCPQEYTLCPLEDIGPNFKLEDVRGSPNSEDLPNETLWRIFEDDLLWRWLNALLWVRTLHVVFWREVITLQRECSPLEGSILGNKLCRGVRRGHLQRGCATPPPLLCRPGRQITPCRHLTETLAESTFGKVTLRKPRLSPPSGRIGVTNFASMRRLFLLNLVVEANGQKLEFWTPPPAVSRLSFPPKCSTVPARHVYRLIKSVERCTRTPWMTSSITAASCSWVRCHAAANGRTVVKKTQKRGSVK